MSREIRLLVEHERVARNLVWISLQDNGAISVGFLGQAIIVQGFTSEQELDDGMREAKYIDIQARHKLEAITDPHFTIHPPAYFHLRSGNNPPLLEALVWTKPAPGELASPWIRFVSSPVKELAPLRPITATRLTTIETLQIRSDDCSIAVNFDFVDERGGQLPLVKERKARVIAWRDISMLVYAYPVPSQPATLGYLIRG